MKRSTMFISAALTAALAIGPMAGCGNQSDSASTDGSAEVNAEAEK